MMTLGKKSWWFVGSVMFALASLLILGCSGNSPSTDPNSPDVTRTPLQQLTIGGNLFTSLILDEGMIPDEVCFYVMKLSTGGLEINYANVNCRASGGNFKSGDVTVRLRVGDNNLLYSDPLGSNPIGQYEASGRFAELCTGTYAVRCRLNFQTDSHGEPRLIGISGR
jgi:hypothetical protein